MGFYTQIRGWLEVADNPTDRLEQVKREHLAKYEGTRANWMTDGTLASAAGFDGAFFIFVGTQLKNYDEDWENWLKSLLEAFPKANGRWDIQAEDQWPSRYDDPADNVLTVRIADGVAICDYDEVAWCKGA